MRSRILKLFFSQAKLAPTEIAINYVGHCLMAGTEARPTAQRPAPHLRLRIQLVLVFDIERQKLMEITNHKTQITNKSQ